MILLLFEVKIIKTIAVEENKRNNEIY